MNDRSELSISHNCFLLQVYFDISIDDRPAGKVVFELYADKVRLVQPTSNWPLLIGAHILIRDDPAMKRLEANLMGCFCCLYDHSVALENPHCTLE
jgi:hypothetical protein